jgi:hypothetical protein
MIGPQALLVIRLVCPPLSKPKAAFPAGSVFVLDPTNPKSPTGTMASTLEGCRQSPLGRGIPPPGVPKSLIFSNHDGFPFGSGEEPTLSQTQF